MSDAVPDAGPDVERERRRRLEEVFGDVLPETTSDDRDDRDDEARDAGRGDDRDRWLRSQVPPHHG